MLWRVCLNLTMYVFKLPLKEGGETVVQISPGSVFAKLKNGKAVAE